MLNTTEITVLIISEAILLLGIVLTVRKVFRSRRKFSCRKLKNGNLKIFDWEVK